MTERVEIGWYTIDYVRANLAPDGEALPPDVIAELPKGMAERLNETSDAHSAVIDEILTHLRETRQEMPPFPREG